MKKTIAILLVICSIAAIFAGCSKSNPIDEIIADQAAETPAADAGTDTAPEKEETPEKEPSERLSRLSLAPLTATLMRARISASASRARDGSSTPLKTWHRPTASPRT